MTKEKAMQIRFMLLIPCIIACFLLKGQPTLVSVIAMIYMLVSFGLDLILLDAKQDKNKVGIFCAVVAVLLFVAYDFAQNISVIYLIINYVVKKMNKFDEKYNTLLYKVSVSAAVHIVLYPMFSIICR